MRRKIGVKALTRFCFVVPRIALLRCSRYYGQNEKRLIESSFRYIESWRNVVKPVGDRKRGIKRLSSCELERLLSEAT